FIKRAFEIVDEQLPASIPAARGAAGGTTSRSGDRGHRSRVSSPMGLHPRSAMHRHPEPGCHLNPCPLGAVLALLPCQRTEMMPFLAPMTSPFQWPAIPRQVTRVPFFSSSISILILFFRLARFLS